MRCFPFVLPEGYWKGDTKSQGVAPYGATPGTNITVASCTTWLDLACNIGSTCNEACTRARTFAHLATVLVSSRNIVHIIVLPFLSRDL